MFKKIIVWNNPFLSFDYKANIDFETGKVFYKTNDYADFHETKKKVHATHNTDC